MQSRSEHFGEIYREGETCCIIFSVFVEQEHTTCDFSSGDSWVILSDIEKSIKRKIEAAGTPLSDWDVNIYRGVLTGYNDAFIISGEKRKEILANCKSSIERKKTDALIRPILRGRDIKRYGYEWADLWLIATFPSRNYDIDQYPAVKKHLLSFGIKRLEQTGKRYVINGEEIKARKRTNNKWFEVQDSISYWEDFNRPKIMYSEIVREPQFYLDTNEHFYPEATTFILTGEHLEYLTDLLNSPITAYFFKKFYSGGGLGEDGFRYKKKFLENLPIVKPVRSKARIDEEFIYKSYGLTQHEIEFIQSQIN